MQAGAQCRRSLRCGPCPRSSLWEARPRCGPWTGECDRPLTRARGPRGGLTELATLPTVVGPEPVSCDAATANCVKAEPGVRGLPVSQPAIGALVPPWPNCQVCTPRCDPMTNHWPVVGR